MGDYGKHPTRYGSLSDDDLYAMYRSSVWRGLGEDQRLDLLQETVNRDAAQRGEVGAPVVRFDSLEPHVAGEEGQGKITLNREMFVNDRQIRVYKGQIISRPLQDANLRALTTCVHENIHAWQEQCVDGTIPCPDPALLEQYRANQFDQSAVEKPDGGYGPGLQYLRGSTPNGFYLYKLQSTERDAFRWSEAKTLAVMKGLLEKYGKDPSFAAYMQELRANGYQADLRRAAGLFQNPNIERDINRTLMNEYYNRHLPVDPDTARAVRNEMLSSCEEMKHANKQFSAASGGDKMKEITDWMDLHVSPEEYDASLHSTVNAFYAHELNTGVSQEEAMQNTAQVAEAYLQASQEFRDNAAANAANGIGENGTTNGNGSLGGVSTDGGSGLGAAGVNGDAGLGGAGTNGSGGLDGGSGADGNGGASNGGGLDGGGASNGGGLDGGGASNGDSLDDGGVSNGGGLDGGGASNGGGLDDGGASNDGGGLDGEDDGGLGDD